MNRATIVVLTLLSAMFLGAMLGQGLVKTIEHMERLPAPTETELNEAYTP